MSVEFNTTCHVAGNEIPVVLYFNEDDPACVRFQFFNAGDESSPEWEFSRDLLSEVLDEGNAGMGDVQLHLRSGLILFTFHSNTGTAEAVFTEDVINEFVEFIYDEIPEGEESYEIPDGVPEEWLV